MKQSENVITGVNGVDFFFEGDEVAVDIATRCLSGTPIAYVNNECLCFAMRRDDTALLSQKLWAVTAFWSKKQKVPTKEIVNRMIYNQKLGQYLADYILDKLPLTNFRFVGTEFYCDIPAENKIIEVI